MRLKFPKINEQVHRLGIKQKVMAEAIGIPTSTLSDRLAGRTEWTLSEGVAIAKWLGVSLDELTAQDDGKAA